jgi:hypothetical protein
MATIKVVIEKPWKERKIVGVIIMPGKKVSRPRPRRRRR